MSRPGSNSSVRWAAIGAAVAISLGAGGFGIARATSPSGAAAFVPITPCRLFDTRPDSAVGDRTVPIGGGDTHTVTATGEQGNCDLPTSATGVVLNMTAVGATQATFLTVWPKGEDRPTASSLNPTPGGAAAPNAVTVDLSDDGAFSVFNRFGSVHVLADVVGYYTDHHHDDRYYTEAEVDAMVAPWRLQSSKTALEYLGDLAPSYGLAATDLSAVFTEFGLPPEYEPGSDVLVELVFISVVEPAGCTVRFAVDDAFVLRDNEPASDAETSFEPSTGGDPGSIGITLPGGELAAAVRGTATIRISGADLQPGDWFRPMVTRQGDHPSDTCAEVYPLGMTAREG